jgi:CheY-like chemotaxis protein
MSTPSDTLPPRVLLVDDGPAIHEDFRKILCPAQRAADAALQDVAAQLFGDAPAASAGGQFVVDSAFQGQEALERVRAALREERPYALAFVDVRMPPGWDGIETIARIWQEQPDLQVVICTAYSD